MYKLKGKGYFDLNKIPENMRDYKEFHELVDFYGTDKYENYAGLISFLWNNHIYCGDIIANEITIIDENEKEYETFIYNKEKKGYRLIEPVEWE